MRKILIITILVVLASYAPAQNQKMIQRSWIKTSIENLSNRPAEPDTMYLRYTFSKTALDISFSPAWDDYKQNWSVTSNKLTIGYDAYTIEELTDSTLTISLEGFRRVRFMSEDYLNNQEKYLVSAGEYNGKPLYKANRYITPRYSGKEQFRQFVQKNAEGYNIKKATYFFATFIVTESGKVENVKIVKGITDGFDRDITKQLLKTSKDWKPATFQGKPIQVEMYYDIKYLDSLTPFNSNMLD